MNNVLPECTRSYLHAAVTSSERAEWYLVRSGLSLLLLLPRVHTFTFRRPLQRALQRQPASSSTFPLVTDNTCTVTSASHHRTHRATCSCTRNRNAKLHCAGGSPVSHLPASHLRLFALSLAIIFSIALPPRFSLGEFNQCSGLQSYQGFNSINWNWIPGLITHKLPQHCFLILSTNQLRTPKCVISLLISNVCLVQL